jgi:hypothetical protein
MGRGGAEFAATLGIHVPYMKLEGLPVTCPHDGSERGFHTFCQRVSAKSRLGLDEDLNLGLNLFGLTRDNNRPTGLLLGHRMQY